MKNLSIWALLMLVVLSLSGCMAVGDGMERVGERFVQHGETLGDYFDQQKRLIQQVASGAITETEYVSAMRKLYADGSQEVLESWSWLGQEFRQVARSARGEMRGNVPQAGGAFIEAITNGQGLIAAALAGLAALVGLGARAKGKQQLELRMEQRAVAAAKAATTELAAERNASRLTLVEHIRRV